MTTTSGAHTASSSGPTGRHLTVTPRAAAIVTGVIGLAIGLAVLVVLPAQTGVASRLAAMDAAGPGFFPLIAGLLTTAAGLWCLLGGRGPASPQGALGTVAPLLPVDAPETLPWRPFIGIAVWLAAVVLGTVLIGLLAALGVAAAGLAGAFGERRIVPRLAVGLVTPIAIYLVFELALKVQFPRGIWF
jgi:hypothetical protein